MNLEAIRQAFRPLLGVEKQSVTARLLYAIAISIVVIDLIAILLRLFSGATFGTSSTLRVLVVLLLLQGLLLWLVRRGSLNKAALVLIISSWAAITYQVWSADGVRDVAIYLYGIVILLASLLSNWKLSAVVFVLSLSSIWALAFMEAQGLRTSHIDAPLNIARDLTAIFLILFFLLYLIMDTIRQLVGVIGEAEQKRLNFVQRSGDALRRSEARTRALLDAIPDLIFEFKRDGTILEFISSAASQPLLPPEEFLGKTIQDVLPDPVVNQTMFAIQRVLESGQVNAFEYPLVQEGESRTFEARITPLGADTVLAIVRDVSLQKWILGEREKLINELEAKNAELERFTYTVSHDLKSPLITIKGFLGFLQQDAQTGNLERLNTDLRRISDAADKMQRLLNDLLELSRIGRLVHQPEAIDLNKMVAEVLELLHGRIHNGNVRVQVQPELPRIYGDRQRLFEVFQNLVDNAAKFMGDQPDPCIQIGQEGKTENGLPIFYVRDNGIGIDPKFRDRIFGLFDKLDPRSDGTGIGLALAKRIIEFHGGRIWVESQKGEGTTFYFSLPPV